MKGILIFAAIIAAVLGWTQFDRRFGDRIRSYYDERERWGFPVVMLGSLVILSLLSLVLSPPNLELAILVGIYALLAMGLNVVVGFAGLLDLGYVAFFAIGAYTMAILSNAGPLHLPWHLNFWEIFPIGIVIALVAGLLLGAPTLRLRGDYLAIVTLGFGEIVRILAENLEKVTNGAKGITAIPHPSIGGHNFGVGQKPYYLLLVAAVFLFILIIRSLNNSRVGRAWAAIREDEFAAESMGVPTLKYKLWAFAIGASTACAGGMIYGAKISFVSPESFQFIISIYILSAVVLGGLGSTVGAIIGGAAIILVPEMLRSLPERLLDARFGVFGLALVLMMIFRPEGIVPSRRRKAELKGGAAETMGPIGAGLPPGAEMATGTVEDAP
ncbi:MAG TPA: branched-chain amino acid ABC transporter permease [Actinomycetota bacterium]|nr:branched-chain amino acid ABC transporter permease [Actinomycetota bacterium]